LHDGLWALLVSDSDNLTPLQYALMTALELEPNIDQRTLGDRVALDKSTVGDLLARMSAKGLVRRHNDENDGRRRLLELTEEGRDVLYAIAPAVNKIGRRMLEALDPDERTELMRLLDKVVYSPAAVALTPGVDPTIPPRQTKTPRRSSPSDSSDAGRATAQGRRRRVG
jgi:DNA-binding MarR family transcriptional regulator